MLGLSACNRAAEQPAAQGYVSSTPESAEESATLPAALPATPPAVEVPAPTVAYADVIAVKPVTVAQKILGTVTDTRELVQTSTEPQQVCADVVVQERLPERDGNKGGAVIGAVVGGLIGNQVGGGNGKTLATVAGAVGGGFAGREIDSRSENGKIVSKTEQQCHTENRESSTVTGYQVTYRKADGSTGSMRMGSEPSIGSSIDLGSTRRTVGYDVTYSFEGKQSTVRMDRKPGAHLPVVDGMVVLESQPISRG
ncbi:MAG: glycine zipper 2TM domain-containing protein [Arenimonas sp.]|nr:glycine zipper 2TM domain-containing protein [Arenimonas sp.]